MSELALKLIRENIEKRRQGEDARFLDLGNCGMTEVPEEIGKCVWIEELVLGSAWDDWIGNGHIEMHESSNNEAPNDIVKLPEKIAQLNNLKRLWLYNEHLDGRSSLDDLSFLATLTNLEQLDFSLSNVSDLTPIKDLKNLRSLIFWETNVEDLSSISSLSLLENLHVASNVNDLSPIKNLYQLREVNLTYSMVTDLSPLKNLNKLETINLAETFVSRLEPLSNIVNLKTLIFFGSKVVDIKPISGLKNLEYLDFTGTNVSDISPISRLKKLKYLWFPYSGVLDLSPLSSLKKLDRVACGNTRVQDLTPLVKKIKNGWPVFKGFAFKQGISIDDCPLIIPPLEVAQESPQAVRDYFEELGDDGRKLNEVKVIFLGEASAGKTSLVRRLLNEKFDSKESQTHGIRIRKAPFTMEDGDEVTAHLWDFGGQEVMHATHQFFLSQRSVYVLLLNSRNDDQAEKWLKYAGSLGGRSPVLVVLNKIDENPSFEVNRKTLQEKYPQIRAFFRLSAKTDAGLNDFREALRYEIDRADTRRTPFPKHWLAVKEQFSNMTADDRRWRTGMVLHKPNIFKALARVR